MLLVSELLLERVLTLTMLETEPRGVVLDSASICEEAEPRASLYLLRDDEERRRCLRLSFSLELLFLCVLCGWLKFIAKSVCVGDWVCDCDILGEFVLF
jgi:hypothetical protein